MMLSSFTFTRYTSKSNVCFTPISPNIWVIDSEASERITGNKDILSTLNSIFLLLLIILADGSTFYTEGVCTANAKLSLSLSFVLYIPKFSFNLLSVSELTNSLNYLVTFFYHCVSQEVFIILREVLKR